MALVCTCRECGVAFVDPLDIFPGPAWCQECVEREKRQRKTRGSKRRTGRPVGVRQ